MVLTIKINYDGDIRRKAIEEVTYDSVVKMISDSFPEISTDNLQMKYPDEEGDMCSLVRMTFPDFIATQSSNKVMKIQVSKKKEVASPSSGGPCTGVNDSSIYDTLPEEGTADAKEGNYEKGHYKDCAGESWGHGCHGHGGGPFMLISVIHALKEDGVLSPRIFAALFVQWLPMITQRITRKLDKINYTVQQGMNTSISSFILVLQHHVATAPALEQFAAQFQAILDQEPNAPLLGDTLRSFLIALQAQAFEAQVSFVENLFEALLPLLDDVMVDFPEMNRRPWPMIHHGVTCDHCGACPIAGPRFKCTTCHNYDLCGNCFTQKTSIHAPEAPDATPHDFQCILSPHDREWKGKGKGKGKGHRKGWGKGHKGFGKGHMIHNLLANFAPFMPGFGAMDAGFKGWGKGARGDNAPSGHPQGVPCVPWHTWAQGHNQSSDTM